MGKIRVLVVDDNPVVRDELPELLESDGDIEVIGAAGNGRDAVRRVDQSQPDVVVMDIKMPGMDGVSATRIIRENNPSTRVVMLSIYDKDTFIEESIEAGASAYVVKSGEVDTLANAIRRAFAEEPIRACKEKSKRKKNHDKGGEEE